MTDGRVLAFLATLLAGCGGAKLPYWSVATQPGMPRMIADATKPAPATDAPATDAPATDATTGVPATDAPATGVPATGVPATGAPRPADATATHAQSPPLEFLLAGIDVPRVDESWDPPAREHDDLSDGSCGRNLRVHVVDSNGAPVAGAEVIARTTQHLNAPSTVPVDLHYQSKVVRTNARGEATTCSPDAIPSQHDMFGSMRGGAVVARSSGKIGLIVAPYTSPIILR